MHITKVQKDNSGKIQNVQMDDGQVYSIEEAINLAADGQVEGVNVGRTKDGQNTLRSNPDGDVTNNLDNLPNF